MIPWAIKRKIQYTIGFIGVFFVIVAYPVFSAIYDILNKPPTCFDSVQNQDETGIDCGGSCVFACAEEVNDIVVLWTRLFKVEDGVYDAVALVRNPNLDAAATNVKYNFNIYDKHNKPISKTTDSDYINTGEDLVIFEANIRTGDKIPSRVFFTLEEKPTWLQSSTKLKPIKVISKRLTKEKTAPRLDIVLENVDFVKDFYDVDVVALIRDTDGNVIASSKTYIDYFGANVSKNIFFVWPEPFQNIKSKECANLLTSTVEEIIIPGDIILVFDRSGSMNDDGGSPVQPITNAKNAAVSFVNKMMSNDQLGLVSFATEASSPIDQELTGDFSNVGENIQNIVIGTPDNKQHTNLGDAIEEAVAELLSSRHNSRARSAIIVLTDGIASRPINPEYSSLWDDEKYPEEYARLRAQDAQNNDILVYVIGLGSDVNKEFLSNQIATTPDYFYHATNSGELESIYSQIAEVVNKEKVLTTEVCQDDIFISDLYIRIKNEELINGN